jgi:hypothetical protein
MVEMPTGIDARVVALSAMVVATLLILPASTRAQASPPPQGANSSPSAKDLAQKLPPGYEQTVDLAFNEFELGNYPEARARFLEAHKLLPNARTFRALGMVEYELRNYGDAIEQLRQALDSKVRPLEGSSRGETAALLARAKGYVARISLEVNPGVATVVVDGMPMQIAPGGALLLQVGDHNLEFRAPGRLAETRRLKIKGGEEETLKVVLPPAMEASTPPRAERKPMIKNPWLWTAVGVVVAGAAAGTAIALTRGDPNTQIAEPYAGNAGAAVLRSP